MSDYYPQDIVLFHSVFHKMCKSVHGAKETHGEVDEIDRKNALPTACRKGPEGLKNKGFRAMKKIFKKIKKVLAFKKT